MLCIIPSDDAIDAVVRSWGGGIDQLSMLDRKLGKLDVGLE